MGETFLVQNRSAFPQRFDGSVWINPGEWGRVRSSNEPYLRSRSEFAIDETSLAQERPGYALVNREFEIYLERKATVKPAIYVPKLKDLTVIVLAHDHDELTGPCLRALEASDGKGFRTILVDNGSAQPLNALFDGYQRRPKTLVRNEANLAFARANNEAARLASTPYLLLLNNDCYVGPRTLGLMRGAFEQDPAIGIVGAKLLYPDGHKVQHCGVVFVYGRFPVHINRGDDRLSASTNVRGFWPAVTGACLMVRRDLWEELGGLNEAYAPGGFEDTDLCVAAREKGYRIWYESDAEATHEETATYFRSGRDLLRARKEADDRLTKVFWERWAKYPDLNNLGAQPTARGAPLLIL